MVVNGRTSPKIERGALGPLETRISPTHVCVTTYHSRDGYCPEKLGPGSIKVIGTGID